MEEMLFTEICKHITLGQWELAKACIFVYIQTAENESENENRRKEIKDLLLGIGTYPLKCCMGSTTIPTPFHLSWLCAQLLLELNINTNEVAALKNYADFNMLLYRTCEFVQDVPYEECCNNYCINYDRKINDDPVLLSHQVIKYIQDVIEKDPLLAHFIDKALEAPFMKHTNVITTWLEEQCHKIKHLKQRKETEMCQKLVKKTLAVLSTEVAMSEMELLSDNLHDHLFDLYSSQFISSRKIYKALFASTTNLQHFCYIENRRHNRIGTNESLESIEEILRTTFISKDTLNLKEIFLRTVLNKTHFLTLIVTYFIEMIKIGQYTLIHKCLENLLVAPLRPLIILLAWDHINTLEDAIATLNMLWPPELVKDQFDPLLSDGCNRLSLEIEMISWCLKEARSNPNAVKNVISFTQLKDMIRGSSFLSTIYNCFNLSKINEDDIQAILKKVASKTVKKKEKSVRFAGSSLPISTDNSADLIIFQGYVIISSVMNAIYYSNQETSEISDKKLAKHTVEDISSASEEKKVDASSHEDNVSSNLNKAIELLQKLYPVSYRVEILETIFSLLFLTDSDLKDDSLSDSECEDLEDDNIMQIKTKRILGQNISSNINETSSCDCGNNDQYQTDENVLEIRSSNLSENTSSFSTCSSSSTNSGFNNRFLCSDKLLFDIILLLKDCVMETSMLIENKQHLLPITWDQFFNPENNSIIDEKNLLLILNRLKQYIHEALWKYQLISVQSSEETILCNIEIEPSQYYLTENSESSRNHKHQKNSKKKNSEKILLIRSSHSEASSSSNSKQSPRRRKFSRNSTHFQYIGKCYTINCHHKTINCMLSSPVSLLNQCLLQGDSFKASQIIQMFDLGKTDYATEATFIMEFPNLKNQISIQDKQQHSLPSSSPVYSSDINSLRNIVLTAAAGLSNTSDAGLLENLFSHCSIPKIHELSSLLNSEIPDSIFPRINECQDLRALVMVDLMFSAQLSLELSSNICLHSLKRIHNSMQRTSNASNKYSVGESGIVSLLQRLSDFLTIIVERQTDDYPLFKNNIMKKYSSLSEVLTETVDPLNAFDYSLMMDSLNTLLVALNDYSEKAEKAGIEENSGNISINPEHMVAANKAFKRLVNASSEIVGHGILFLDDVEVTSKQTKKKYPDYLKSFYIYLKQLAVLYNHCNLDSEASFSESTCLEVLNKDVTETLGNVILKENVMPECIEKFADKINIDLRHIIAITVSGKLPAYGINHSPKAVPSFQSYPFILNTNHIWKGEVRHPEIASRELLSDTIKFLTGFFPNKKAFDYDDLLQISSDLSFYNILNATEELAHIDLKLLHGDQEWLSFLINTYNLFMIHSLLIENFRKPLKIRNSALRFSDACKYNFVLGKDNSFSIFDLYCLLTGATTQGLEMPQEIINVLKETLSIECSLPQPQLVFVLNIGNADSPKLQIMKPETVLRQVEVAMIEYIQTHLLVDDTKKQVVIPELIDKYLEKEISANKIKKLSYFFNEIQENAFSSIIHSFPQDLDDENLYEEIISVRQTNDRLQLFIEYERNSDNRCIVEHEEIMKISYRQPPKSIQNYMIKKCWLVNYFLEVFSGDYVPDDKCKLLNHYLDQFKDVPIYNVLLPTYHDHNFWIELKDYLSSKDWLSILKFLDISLQLHPEMRSSIVCLKDYLYCMLAAEPSNEAMGWKYVEKMYDSEKCARCVLAFYKKWDFKTCQYMLELCKSDSSLSRNMTEKLNLIFKQVEIYEKILPYVKANGSWQSIAEECEMNIEEIYKVLLSENLFQFTLELDKFHKIPFHLQQLQDMKYLQHLLDSLPPDIVSATKMLENLNSSSCVELCKQIYTDVKNISAKLFILEILLIKHGSCLQEHDKQSYMEFYLGLKVFQSLPLPEQKDFCDILMSPFLMIEQMIMNMKIEFLSKAVKILHDEAATINMQCNEEIDRLLRKYAEKAIEVPIVTPSKRETSQLEMLSPSSKLTIPPIPPTKDQWIPDEAVTQCMLCKQGYFSMLNRRHHCRRCGNVICRSCSVHRLEVDGYNGLKVRVCNRCFECETYPSSFESHSPNFCIKSRRVSSSSVSASQSSLNFHHSPSVSKHLTEEEYVWKLTSDKDHNSTVRDEFNFEEIPNVHLCISLLELHIDKKECAYYLLKLCTLLLTKLCTIKEGTPNPEVDYDLVINMVEKLLLTAKFKFSEIMDHVKISACDHVKTYIAILQLLIRNNCHHLFPTDIDLLPDFARKLYKLLIEEERWELAIEITTKMGKEKVGLDPSGVWLSWGLAALKAGDYASARKKISHAFIKVSDGHQNQFISKGLEDILNILEGRLYSQDETVGSVSASLASLKRIEQLGLLNVPLPQCNGSAISQFFYEECLFYLDSYATPIGQMNFLIKHHKFRDALNNLLEKKYNTEVFIIGIIIPCLKTDEIHLLEDEICRIDPTLQKFRKYLNATCEYLENENYLNCLLHFQDFIKDYDSAASTCVKLYCKDANNYKMLYEHLEYLHIARKYLEMFLDCQLRMQSSTPKSKLKKTPFINPQMKKINKKIRAIELQIEVNKFLVQTESLISKLPKESLAADKVKHNITLFGTSANIIEICSMVLMSGKTVEDGFGIVFRIIQEFDLNLETVFSMSARNLIKQHRILDVQHLIACIQTSGKNNHEIIDEVISNCVCNLAQEASENREVELLIKMMHSIERKINAYILCGKLKSAYLLAVGTNSISHVKRILSEAERRGQPSIKNICEKWLALQKTS